ncbi:hypothetical protein [Burkholderia stagnalis]|uniref:hypothetical protein n=1 Tax=Burkholderia stagnalis TaxID=1503054 RepID=UPI0021AB26C2|nr:hypothetical protein [Burkholderia stagnalis]
MCAETASALRMMRWEPLIARRFTKRLSRVGGRDDYTGEELDWTLLSKYANAESQEGRHHYKAGFALLPTVDHVDASASAVAFKVCAWRTNDAKNDLSVDGFIALCARVLIHAGYRVEPPEQERAA